MLLCVCGYLLRAQDYIAYQRLLNRCDNDILAGELSSALLRMDTLDRGYGFIYARHCMKGLQLACQCDDERRAALWMQRALLQGVPVWAIRSNGITKAVFEWQSILRVVSLQDSLHAIYRSRMDTALARRVSKLIARDYWYTRRVNDGFVLFRHTLYGLQWKANNRRQIAGLAALIAKYGFPEERLIGLPESIGDSAAMAKPTHRGGIDLALQNRQVFCMFLHYFSSRRTDMNALLLPQIAIGNLPPYQYARMNDYLSRYTSSKRYPAYHEFHAIGAAEDTSGLGCRRSAIGLSDYAEGDRNRNLKTQREFSGKANEEMILE